MPAAAANLRPLFPSFLYQMDHLGEEDYTPNPVLEKALDTLFLLHADHELNASCMSICRARMQLSHGIRIQARRCCRRARVWSIHTPLSLPGPHRSMALYTAGRTRLSFACSYPSDVLTMCLLSSRRSRGARRCSLGLVTGRLASSTPRSSEANAIIPRVYKTVCRMSWVHGLYLVDVMTNSPTPDPSS